MRRIVDTYWVDPKELEAEVAEGVGGAVDVQVTSIGPQMVFHCPIFQSLHD